MTRDDCIDHAMWCLELAEQRRCDATLNDALYFLERANVYLRLAELKAN